jgi:hypothetical protein
MIDDPILQSLINRFQDGPLFVPDGEEPEDVLPGITRAMEAGLVKEVQGSGFDYGKSYHLVRNRKLPWWRRWFF